MIKKLLYLEDDEALAFVTKRAMQKRGFAVEHVATLAALREHLKKADFSHALLDLKIGNDTSIELIDEIKKARDIPIVILTGYGTIRTAVQAIKYGAIDFLNKPCSVDDVISALCATDIEEIINVASNNLEKPSLKSIERETIQRALDENNGNISAAARQLKMHRRTLQRKLIKRHLEDDKDYE